MNSPFDDHISADTAVLFENPVPIPREPKGPYLLWGDGVEILDQNSQRTKVRARGRNRTGWVDNDALGGQSLMEFYYIDVGQGDGVLMKTPAFEHIMIDGGWPRRNQDTGKNAADFVDWKFYQDYKKTRIELEAMICSHNDQDHYGGLWDLLNADLEEELDVSDVFVQDFYHAGLGWWEKPGSSSKWLGPYDTVDGETFFTQLMSSRASLMRGLNGPGPKLVGEWRQFLEKVSKSKWKDGSNTGVSALLHSHGFLPGFETKSANRPAIRVLGPVEFDVNGKSAVRRFTGGDSQNTNGNSIMLRVDYGRTRTILTGDLNKKSQRALVDDYAGDTLEFECDVAKACHHGSADISYNFLQRLRPAVTIISSGDNEGHDHPRPGVVAASATTGYFEQKNDELVSPLIFSTELARSVSFGNGFKLELLDTQGNAEGEIDGAEFDRSRIHYKETKSGDRHPKTKSRRMDNSLIVAGLIYGLVNVRTDGETIMCATMDEKHHNWRIHKLKSRF